MFRALFLILLVSTTCFAESGKYGQYDIPIIEGAYEVERERNDRFHTYSVSYKLKIGDTNKVNVFYDKYFKKLGWKDPITAFDRVEEEMKIRWRGYNSTFNLQGFPEIHYSSVWEAKSLPARGVLSMMVSDYKDGKFYGKVLVKITPKLDLSPVFEFQKKLMEDPKNIFVIYRAIGENPFNFDQDIVIREPKYKENEIVKQYFKMIDRLKLNYDEFKLKYITH